MDFLIAFIIFMSSIITCLLLHTSLCYALTLGLICFFMTGLHRGFRVKDLLKMVYNGGKTSFIVIKILFFIGCLTALWRASGTVSFFVYYGIKIITPHMFIVVAFLLPLVLSFALGTSFGVVGTAGVMLMILARSSGVDPLVVAGAIMSGAYFGDRCSPASSAAALTANVSNVNQKEYMKMMLKTSVFPVAVTLAIFIFLSVKNPIDAANTDILSALSNSFNLSWYVVLPAVIILILPWFKVSISNAIVASGIAAFILALHCQGETFSASLKACFLGYTAASETLGNILSGGGVISMIEVMIIVLLSSTYSGIFDGTGMLKPIQEKIGGAANLIGLFPTQILTAVLSASVFCNQTVGTVLAAQMLGNVYEEKGRSREELAADIGNSIITIAGLIPWSIAATVPLTMMEVGSGALIYSVLLYAVPICYLLTKKVWYKTL
jgi:Na+/H+ antiporter